MKETGDENDEVLKEFLTESSDGLDRMGEDLLRLEQNPNDAALVASLFRTMHTIKGTCGFLGLTRLESFSHLAESVLSALRDQKVSVDADLVSALILTTDLSRRMLASIESQGNEGDTDTSRAEEALRAALAGPSAKDKSSKLEAADRELVASLRRQISKLPPAPLSKQPSVTEPLRDFTEDVPTGTIGELLVKRGVATEEQVQRAVDDQRRGDPRRLGEILIERGSVRPADVKDALIEQGEIRVAAALENIRVDISLLDKLMNQVGELVLIRNQIQQFTARFPDRAFASAAQRLNLITTELQEGVVKARMQPIGTLWAKFPRLVRHLSGVLERQVTLEMTGNETELDRTIIDAIRDPLTHIVRNSVDHGIEPAKDRVAAGKSPNGTISLRAFHEGGQVNIEITDDGRGIDPDALRERAVKTGVLSAVEAARLSDREALSLVFRAGLSTAKQITSVSGRGVGMDVVKTNIERIGGTVDIQSRRGIGSTIKIKIPLTLAIIPALMVTTGGECYALPQISLVEVVRLDGQSARGAIEYVSGAPVYRLRGSLLPLLYLSAQLDDLTPGARDDVNIVILSADERAFGLVVDEINDTAEIVVKPLGPQLKGIGIFAGATILGNGSVALILDVLGLAQRAGIVSDAREIVRHEEQVERTDTAAVQSERLLLLGLGAKRQLALPLTAVSRLEEIPASSVERAGDRLVVQYRGTLLPLVSLANVVGEVPAPNETLQVVVYTHRQWSIGLIVDRILDVVEHGADRAEIPCESRGIRASTVIKERVTDLLDLDQFVPDAAFSKTAVAS